MARSEHAYIGRVHSSAARAPHWRRWLAALAALTLVSGVTAVFVPVVSSYAAGSPYSLDFSAAGPSTYPRKQASQLSCPTPSGGVGRAANPLNNAANDTSVESLTPDGLALGQIIAFETSVKVSGSTVSDSGTVTIDAEWLAKTTSRGNFGFDPAYGVYCSFVDTADGQSVDPGGNAKVSSYSSTTVGVGTSNEAINGSITVSGLDSGDNVIVETWVVLKKTLPAAATGNVQTGVLSATALGGGAVSVGKQTVPLKQVGQFFTDNADLSVTKTDSPDPVIAGQNLTYTVTATNNSTDTVANTVVVTDTLDANTTFVSGSWATGTCTEAAGVVTCAIGALSPGETVTVTIVATVGGAAPNNDTTSNAEAGAAGTSCAATHDLCNVVAISAITTDSTTTNNHYAQPTNVTPANGALTIVKSASPLTYSSVGQTISYSYVVSNSGNITLSGPFTVSDDKTTDEACPVTASLAPGASITCTSSYTITQADLDAGHVTNIASASNGTVTSLTDTKTVNAVPSPALSIVKSATPLTYSAVGQTISYSYVVTNSGNITLAGPFSVSDDKTTDEACPVTASLAPTAHVTCASSYVITQADLDAGHVTNVASASNGTVSSLTDTKTVNALQTRTLAIAKTPTPTTYSSVGQTINYSYLVSNSGNVTLAGPFTVSDDKTTDEACPVTASLAPGASITCTSSSAITQADLNAGHVTNIASASNGPVTSPTDTATVTAVQSPALALDKTATEASYAAVGDVLHYSYLVTNSGNVSLAGPVTVTDNKATVTCPAVSTVGNLDSLLDPTEAVTCTSAYSVTQADLDGGSVTNLATAHAGGTDSLPDTVTVNAARAPALHIAKSASPLTYSTVGQTISYSYVVTNSGNVTLTGPFTVSDDRTSDELCPATASLAPTAHITCTSSYSITQADLDAGHVTNIASASNGTITSPTDTKTVNAVQSPALTIVKSATPLTYSTVGQTISYSYLVTNSGNVTLPGPFTVSDDRTTNESCPATVSLAPGGHITCTSSYLIAQADLNSGSVTNIASASNGPVTSLTDTKTVTAVQSPALTLDKSATEASYVAVGDVLHYSYVVTNSGNVSLAGPVTVTDNKTTVTCPAVNTVGNLDSLLDPTEALTCSAAYTVSQVDLDAGSVINIAQGHAANTNSATDTVTVPALQHPALTIAKSATPATYSTVNQTISYSYLVTNSGNVTLTGPFTVSDNKATATCPTTATLAPTDHITCTASYPITQADIDAGQVTNVASASNGTVTSPTDSATVTAIQSPALSIDKTATETTYAAVGTVLHYSYLVTNVGNVTLHSAVTVTDDKTAATCPALPAAGLAPHGTVTCTASSTVTQADIDGGLVTNVAFARSGETTSPTDTVTVTATRTPALSLTKTASPTSYSSVGTVISYSYGVTNSGNVTLSGPFTVADNKVGVSCPSTATLAPKASITCSSSHTITQGDLDAGSIVNLATASGGGVTSNQATATVFALADPGFGLSKSANPASGALLQPGDVISYTLTYTNTGNVTLGDKLVTDPLPANSVFGTIADGGTFDAATGIATWHTGAVGPGGSRSFHWTVTVATGLPAGSEVVNVGNVDGTSSNETRHSVASGDLTLVKSASSPTVVIGGTLTYTLTATATGTLNQTGVVVTDVVPAGTTYVPGSAAPAAIATYDATTRTVTWNVGNLAAGASSDALTFSVTVDSRTAAADGSVAATTISNSGLVQSAQTPATPSNTVVTTSPGVLAGVPSPQPVEQSPSPSPSPAPTGGGIALPFTGAGVPTQLAVLVALVMIGIGVLLASVRRRRTS